LKSPILLLVLLLDWVWANRGPGLWRLGLASLAGQLPPACFRRACWQGRHRVARTVHWIAGSIGNWFVRTLLSERLRKQIGRDPLSEVAPRSSCEHTAFFSRKLSNSFKLR